MVNFDPRENPNFLNECSDCYKVSEYFCNAVHSPHYLSVE